MGHPDGELTRLPNLVEELARQIRRIRPDRLLTWDAWRPYELHPDHRAAGMAAVDAVLAAGNPHFYPEQLWAVGTLVAVWRIIDDEEIGFHVLGHATLFTAVFRLASMSRVTPSPTKIPREVKDSGVPDLSGAFPDQRACP